MFDTRVVFWDLPTPRYDTIAHLLEARYALLLSVAMVTFKWRPCPTYVGHRQTTAPFRIPAESAVRPFGQRLTGRSGCGDFNDTEISSVPPNRRLCAVDPKGSSDGRFQ